LRFIISLVLWLTLGMASHLTAQGLPSLTPSPVASLPKPMALTMKDKIQDTSRFSRPKPPSQYIDGEVLNLTIDEDSMPAGVVMLNLSDTITLEQIPEVNKADKHGNQYYWHPFKGWNYAHYRDGDRQWYGWRTGETFHWILWHEEHFWWYDTYAERWLYYDRGYWWWQNLKTPNAIQARLDDGHYHEVDANGALGEDLMATGTVEYVTGTPSPKTTPSAGKKHGGHRGGSGMGKGGALPPPDEITNN